MSKKSKKQPKRKNTPKGNADAVLAGALKRLVAAATPNAKGAPTAADGPARPAPAGVSAALTHKGPPSPSKGKPAKEKKVKKMSGLDAAALVIAEGKKPMNMKAVLEQINGRGLWKSNGKTPGATLYAAIVREIAAKGKEARFKKHDRGLFTAA